VVANQLRNLLMETTVGGDPFDVEILKAREAILSWASSRGLSLPAVTTPPSLAQVETLQNYGDQMRSGRQVPVKKITPRSPVHSCSGFARFVLPRRR